MGNEKIPIQLVGYGNQYTVPLIFDIKSIEKLRSLGISGVLSGTLASATQQNVFLSIPLRLMIEEAIWLVANNYSFFVCSNELLWNAINHLDITDLIAFKEHRSQLLSKQKEIKRQQHLKKLESFGKPTEVLRSDDEHLIYQSLFVETPNSSQLVNFSDVNKFDTTTLQNKFISILIERYSSHSDYLLYKYLKERSYFLSPGARFGGRFIAYPGDPLRYHSHMIVHPVMDYYNESIDLLSLVSGSRLGTGVKKLWIIGGVRYKEITKDEKWTNFIGLDCEPYVSCFSVEWAGFG